MSKSHVPAIRELLRREPDGLTLLQISQRLGIACEIVRNSVNRMPDKYIDRWVEPQGRGAYAAVYCVVVPPPDCPRPQPERKKASTVGAHQ